MPPRTLYDLLRREKLQPMFRGRGDSGSGGGGTPDTNSEGQQAFLIIGDSIAQGVGESYGPTPEAGTVYEYNSDTSTIVEIGAEDLLVHNGSNVGSPWPSFGIDYNQASNKKPVFIHRGFGSSTVYTNSGDTDNTWIPSNPNSHYQDAVTSANDCMAIIGTTRLKAIFIILGINDAAQASTIANVRTAWIALIDKLIEDFPDTDIVICQNGRSYIETGNSVALTNSRMANIRMYIKEMSTLYSNVHLCGNLSSFAANSYYKVDNIHPNQAGNNILGQMFARWMSNSSYTKIARSIISSHFDELSSARKTLINNFFNSIGESTFISLKCLLNFKTTIEQNVYLDWAFLANPLDLGFTFSSNGYIQLGGTNSTIFNSGFVPSLFASNDVFASLKVRTNTKAQGVLAFICGCQDASTPTTAFTLFQNATPQLGAFMNNLPALGATDLKAEDDTYYLWGREGNTRVIKKNNNETIGTDVEAQDSAVARAMVIGGYYQGTSLPSTNLWSGTSEYYAAGITSSFDMSAFYSAMETLIDNW